MKKSKFDVNEVARQIEQELIRIVADCPDSSVRVSRIIHKLDEIKSAWTNRRGAEPQAKVRTGKITGYFVEQWEGESFLVETRSTGAQPFRTPKSHYEAVVEVFAGCGEAMKFEEIRALATERIAEAGEDELPIYRFRIIVRFLQGHKLIRHVARRYMRVGTKTEFNTGSRRVWSEARVN